MPNHSARRFFTRDLASPGLIKLKAVLFLLAGLLSSVLLIEEHPTLKAVFLLVVAIWSFRRLYYFLFYVVDHYLDPATRSSGLLAVARLVLTGRKG